MLIGEQIRKIRLQKGYSQQYIADFIGCSQSKLNRVENGKSDISIIDLLTVCEILDTNMPSMLPQETRLISPKKFTSNQGSFEHANKSTNSEKEVKEEQVAALEVEIKKLNEKVDHLLTLVESQAENLNSAPQRRYL
jgi:transcriptional regulator with XRE-family HTH domain